jgi:hypothetical protein
LRHTSFGSSGFVRQFAAWSPVDVDTGGADVAERLSAWFGPLDAIQLQATLQAAAAPGPESGKSRAPRMQPQALAADVERTRTTLEQAIAKDPLVLAGVKPTDTQDPGFGPWQQRHIELQRQMEQMTGALRDHLRQSIARVSPRLRQLAALDAAFEQLLAPREHALLPAAIGLLERRFLHLRAAHRQACEAAGQPDDPARWREAGGWLATFAQDWRNALLSELELRLQPSVGLAEALRDEPRSDT